MTLGRALERFRSGRIYPVKQRVKRWGTSALEFKINLLKVVISGTLVAKGNVVKKGRRMALAEATVTNEKGGLVAEAASARIILRKAT